MEANLLLLFGIGLVSIVSGWQGLSVGFLAMPVLLIFLPDFSAQVQPKVLILSSVTALVVLILSRRNLELDWNQISTLCVVVAIAAFTVAWFFDVMSNEGCLTIFIFAYIFLVFYGSFMLIPPSHLQSSRFLVVIGFATIASLFCGLLGVGPGYMLLPLLVFSGRELKQSIAISALVEFSASTFALLPRLRIAQWYFPWLIGVIVISALGTLAGRSLSRHYPLSRKTKIALLVGLCGLVLYALRGVIHLCPTFQGAGLINLCFL